MTGHSEPQLCCVGRALQKLGCLPKRTTTNSHVYYPITIQPVDSSPSYGYTDDIKFKPGPRFPPPQPDEPKPQMRPHASMYQQVPKTPKRTPVAQTVPLTTPSTYRQKPLPILKISGKTPIAQTVPLSTLSLPVNALPGGTPATAFVNLNIGPSSAHPTVQTSHTPYVAPLSPFPHTPDRGAVPDSILQDLGGIAPTQYTWNTPQGALTYTLAPTSALLMPNPLANPGSCLSTTISLWDGDNKPTSPGVIPSPFSSNASDSSDPPFCDHRSEMVFNSLLTAAIEWDVSEPVDRARHLIADETFLASASEPATDPPTNTLRIEPHFLDQSGAKWNWEPITIRKGRPIRITDVLYAIHDYFQTQLTRGEYEIIKSHGKANVKIVRDSWRERFGSQPVGEAQLAVRNAGLRRVDCLGSSKNFVGLWVDGSRLKLSLRT